MACILLDRPFACGSGGQLVSRKSSNRIFQTGRSTAESRQNVRIQADCEIEIELSVYPGKRTHDSYLRASRPNLWDAWQLSPSVCALLFTVFSEGRTGFRARHPLKRRWFRRHVAVRIGNSAFHPSPIFLYPSARPPIVCAILTRRSWLFLRLYADHDRFKPRTATQPHFPQLASICQRNACSRAFSFPF